MPNTKTAIIDVADKKGLENLARGLVDLGYRLVLSDDTARFLNPLGLPHVLVSEYVDRAPLLGGALETLHAKIHVGILGGREAVHSPDIASLQAVPVDLVVVNLHSFADAAAAASCAEEAGGLIDVDAPALLRSAAKNFRWVTAICDPDDYETLLWQLATHNQTDPAFRLRMAVKALAHTAQYDASVIETLAAFDAH